MTKEEKGKTYALHKASEKLHDYYGSAMLGVVQFNGYDIQRAYVDGYLQAEQNLEVKEVDLEEEINKFIDSKEVWEIQEAPVSTIEDAAKYFFELGLKAQKGE